MTAADEPLPVNGKGLGASEPRGLWLQCLFWTEYLEIAYRHVAKRLEPGPLRRWQSNGGRRRVIPVWAAEDATPCGRAVACFRV